MQAERWSAEDVGRWLDRIGMGKYKSAFASNHVDGRTLLELTQQDLKAELDIPSLADRKSLWQGLEYLKSGSPTSASHKVEVDVRMEEEKWGVLLAEIKEAWNKRSESCPERLRARELLDVNGFSAILPLATVKGKLVPEFSQVRIHGTINPFLSRVTPATAHLARIAAELCEHCDSESDDVVGIVAGSGQGKTILCNMVQTLRWGFYLHFCEAPEIGTTPYSSTYCWTLSCSTDESAFKKCLCAFFRVISALAESQDLSPLSMHDFSMNGGANLIKQAMELCPYTDVTNSVRKAETALELKDHRWHFIFDEAQSKSTSQLMQLIGWLPGTNRRVILSGTTSSLIEMTSNLSKVAKVVHQDATPQLLAELPLLTTEEELREELKKVLTDECIKMYEGHFFGLLGRMRYGCSLPAWLAQEVLLNQALPRSAKIYVDTTVGTLEAELRRKSEHLASIVEQVMVSAALGKYSICAAETVGLVPYRSPDSVSTDSSFTCMWEGQRLTCYAGNPEKLAAIGQKLGLQWNANDDYLVEESCRVRFCAVQPAPLVEFLSMDSDSLRTKTRFRRAFPAASCYVEPLLSTALSRIAPVTLLRGMALASEHIGMALKHCGDETAFGTIFDYAVALQFLQYTLMETRVIDVLLKLGASDTKLCQLIGDSVFTGSQLQAPKADLLAMLRDHGTLKCIILPANKFGADVVLHASYDQKSQAVIEPTVAFSVHGIPQEQIQNRESVPLTSGKCVDRVLISAACAVYAAPCSVKQKDQELKVSVQFGQLRGATRDEEQRDRLRGELCAIASKYPIQIQFVFFLPENKTDRRVVDFIRIPNDSECRVVRINITMKNVLGFFDSDSIRDVIWRKYAKEALAEGVSAEKRQKVESKHTSSKSSAAQN